MGQIRLAAELGRLALAIFGERWNAGFSIRCQSNEARADEGRQTATDVRLVPFHNSGQLGDAARIELSDRHQELAIARWGQRLNALSLGVRGAGLSHLRK